MLKGVHLRNKPKTHRYKAHTIACSYSSRKAASIHQVILPYLFMDFDIETFLHGVVCSCLAAKLGRNKQNRP